MKKKVLVFSVAMLLAFGFSSCNNEEVAQQENNVEKLAQEEELVSLQNQITDLNTSTFGPTVQTRGFGKWFRRVLGIVMSDAVGGMFGSLIGGPVGCIAGATAASAGVAGSGAVPTFMTRAGIPEKLPMNQKALALENVVLDNNVGILNKETALYDSIGYYHNKVLIDMNNKGKLTSIKDVRALNREIYINTCNELGYEVSLDEAEKVVNHKEIVALVENSSDNFSDYEDMDKYLNDLKKAYPNLSSKLSVVREFMLGLANMDINENDGNYAQKVMELINNSNLDENSKKELRAAIIVGNASYQLWTVE